MSILMIITCSYAFFALCTLAAFAKSHMDTKNFYKESGFETSPAWLRDWMDECSTVPVIKITDGWHGMQAIWHLSFAAAWIIAGFVIAPLSIAWYWKAAAVIGAWIVRLIAQYIGFENTYPIGVRIDD